MTLVLFHIGVFLAFYLEKLKQASQIPPLKKKKRPVKAEMSNSEVQMVLLR
jgi:hypothetical protein